jgi:hypothetical protein
LNGTVAQLERRLRQLEIHVAEMEEKPVTNYNLTCTSAKPLTEADIMAFYKCWVKE